jgi:S-DNA-T family DNA segregation ATPase FtsK/SpoIIIE
VQTFTPDAMSIAEAEATARRLLPLRSGPAVAETGSGSGVQTQRELVDLLGLPDVRDIDFARSWSGRLERDRLRVPIGQDSAGAPLVLDLKESAQQGMGPHGVLIGATGSGKSEVLRTLVLALALTHSPEQLNFVLVDFKGGATFAGMAGMPHVSAIITNLGSELALVDRFQDALQGEVVRRQELLRAAGNFASVSDYEKARKGGRTDLEPLPALLIVADEFSELLAAKPEFVDSFINIGRVGRSLQVHLLLASQRLEEGKLRGLDTYLSYRIGLRTFSAAESRTVLGVPDAYTLPQEPGVGFLKADTENLIQFRAAYVSGAPKTRRRALGASVAKGGAGRASTSSSSPLARSRSTRRMPRRGRTRTTWPSRCRPPSPTTRPPSRSPSTGCLGTAPPPIRCGCRRCRTPPRSTRSCPTSPSWRAWGSSRPRGASPAPSRFPRHRRRAPGAAP